MARLAQKNTNLVENLKEINYRFHTYRDTTMVNMFVFSFFIIIQQVSGIQLLILWLLIIKCNVNF